MTLKNLKEGLEILLKYVTDDTTLVGAEHDVVYVSEEIELPEKEEKMLEERGFRKTKDGWQFFA